MKLFLDRRHAGRVLADRLTEYAGRPDVLVLALPRGGVPVGYEVAVALHAPLDVLTVRKVGAPWNEEYALGAIASGNLTYLDELVIDELGIARADVEDVIARERRELARRDHLYRAGRPFPSLDGRVVILVDDGLATGSTMRAAVLAVQQSHPAAIVVAVPVASAEACRALDEVADRVVCAATPQPFFGVGLWYEDFSETSDREVLALLGSAAQTRLQPVATA
jgi:predicted phosphoribosyltransferase